MNFCWPSALVAFSLKKIAGLQNTMISNYHWNQ